MSDAPVKVCAHRGASATHPENTAAAFDQSVALGCEMIEFDVRRTRDDRYVIMHDATVDRTTNGSGRVADLSFDEIRSLDAGGSGGSGGCGGGQRVLSLDEALAYLPRVMLNIHAYPETPADAEAMAAALIDRLKPTDHRRWFIACGERQLLRRVVELDPDARLCPLFAQNQADYVDVVLRELPCQVIQPYNAIVTRDLVDHAHARGLKVNPFYADDEPEMRRLIACGVDGILTNRPADLLALRGRP